MAGEVAKTLRAVQRLPFVFRTSGTRVPAIFVLPINPEVYRITLPTRGSIQQTMNGSFENFFGFGVGKFMISGTFGFGPHPQYGLAGIPLPGQAQVKLLELLFTAFYREFQSTVAANDAAFDFMDLADGHFLKVRISTFEYERATSHQFLHRYTIQGSVLRDYLAEKLIDTLPANNIFTQLGSTGAVFAGIIGAVGNLALGANPVDTIIRSIGIAAQPVIADMLGMHPLP